MNTFRQATIQILVKCGATHSMNLLGEEGCGGSGARDQTMESVAEFNGLTGNVGDEDRTWGNLNNVRTSVNLLCGKNQGRLNTEGKPWGILSNDSIVHRVIASKRSTR